MAIKAVRVGSYEVREGGQFLIIAGPCVIESYDMLLKTGFTFERSVDQI